VSPCWRGFIVGMVVLSLPAAVPIGAQIREIPGGKFAMGSMDGDEDEAPARTVTLSPYSILAYEVTEAQYDSCVADGRCAPAHYNDGTCRAWNGSRFIKVIIPPSARGPDFPVVCVTWHQALQYCRVRGMTLPTEAQWEHAARGGTKQGAPNRCVISRTAGPRKIGSCAPNGWGVYDMIGNAWEWVNDWYDPLAYGYESATNPAGPPAGLYRVIRGGGWYSTAARATVTNRQWFSPDFAEVSIGFRCAAP
jgi:formylglycine-generating enzyme required for sulfatase activity